MNYKYGCYHSTGSACILYKQDEEDNQSTFNLMAIPERDGESKKIQLYIDNHQIKGDTKFWFGNTDLTVADVYKEFGIWSYGCPNDLELDFQDKIRHTLRSELRVEEHTTETELHGSIGWDDTAKVGVKHTKRKGVKNK